jgi:hypothetical protein
MSISTTWPPAALDAADDTAEEIAAGTGAELPLSGEPQPAARPTLTTAAMTSPKPACGRPWACMGVLARQRPAWVTTTRSAAFVK